MMIRQLTLMLVLFNSFMFLWGAIGMPGTGESSYTSGATYAITFGFVTIFAFIASLAAFAVFNNYSLTPSPNERSFTYLTIIPVMAGIFYSIRAMLIGIFADIGVAGASGMITIILATIGVVLFFTLVQWALSPGQAMQ